MNKKNLTKTFGKLSIITSIGAGSAFALAFTLPSCSNIAKTISYDWNSVKINFQTGGAPEITSNAFDIGTWTMPPGKTPTSYDAYTLMTEYLKLPNIDSVIRSDLGFTQWCNGFALFANLLGPNADKIPHWTGKTTYTFNKSTRTLSYVTDIKFHQTVNFDETSLYYGWGYADSYHEEMSNYKINSFSHYEGYDKPWLSATYFSLSPNNFITDPSYFEQTTSWKGTKTIHELSNYKCSLYTKYFDIFSDASYFNPMDINDDLSLTSITNTFGMIYQDIDTFIAQFNTRSPAYAHYLTDIYSEMSTFNSNPLSFTDSATGGKLLPFDLVRHMVIKKVDSFNPASPKVDLTITLTHTMNCNATGWALNPFGNCQKTFTNLTFIPVAAH